ncbi:hypothetical protein KIN20_026703 [Parelaphostrongylus tenuis]|uniref:Beta-lactamase-related domain-containing protein n=1 Tax=Parelaphostrongylus tenuis TaxID=148309 RepID=A0AAD5WD31_PARTN|nr:hypothetical protein KIN20_026703 [Parelaphostrongylus tenuis]
MTCLRLKHNLENDFKEAFDTNEAAYMSGLPYLDTIITEDTAIDHNLMRKVLEEEKPKFTPGISTGYHVLTYGWLVDQIVRHTDDKRRLIGQFLREEVTEPNGQLKIFIVYRFRVNNMKK